MFDFFRKNNKLFTGLLMLLILPAFVFGGLELYNRAVGPGSGVASVGGRAITQHEWDQAHRQRMQQIRDTQPGIDISLLDTDYAKYQTLERLVDEYAVMEWIAKNKLFVNDRQVQEALLQIPQIAALRGANGQIDTQAYADLLRSNGQTPQSFEAMVRSQLSEQQFMQSIGAATGWQPAILTEQAISPLLQQREVQVAMFPAQDYAAQIKPTEAELRAWYDQHAATRYSVPDQVDLEYLVLDPEAVRKRHPYTDKDLANWYEQNASRYGQPETRRARHILIMADEKADAAAHAAAKQKAEDLLKQIKAQPERFSDLAKAHSQDPGSAAKGGDLGFFNRQTMVKPFADAAFALKAGEISNVVQSKFGYHIIRLDDVKPATVPALQTVRQQVESDFEQDRLKQHFANDARQLNEEISKNRASLQAVAEKMGLPLKTAKGLTANAQPAQGEQAILAHPTVQRAIFEQKTLTSKQASDPISASPNDLVIVRVTEHVPAHVRAYDAVQAQVRTDYVQEKAAALAQEAGKAQLQQWQKNPAAASFAAAPSLISRIKHGAYPNAVVDAALRADVNKLPVLEGADLGQAGYAIVRVTKAAKESEELAAPLRTQYAPAVQQSVAQAQIQAYLESIKQQLKVKINVPKPEVPQGLAQVIE